MPMAKPNKAMVSNLGLMLFPVSLISCDRMGLARPVEQQMFCSNVTTGLPNKIPVAMHVFGADLAQVLVN